METLTLNSSVLQSFIYFGNIVAEINNGLFRRKRWGRRRCLCINSYQEVPAARAASARSADATTSVELTAWRSAMSPELPREAPSKVTGRLPTSAARPPVREQPLPLQPRPWARGVRDGSGSERTEPEVKRSVRWRAAGWAASCLTEQKSRRRGKRTGARGLRRAFRGNFSQ